MAYYNDKVSHLDGRLILYKRDSSTKSSSASNKPFSWYMRINVEGLKGRAVVKSTKRSIYEEAYIVAIAEYERITTAIRLGKGLQTWTFAKHWENWFQRQIDSGNWRNERQTWHQNYYNTSGQNI